MSDNTDCVCDRQLIRKFVNSGQQADVVEIPDAYVVTESGEQLLGSFTYRVQVPGECNGCYDRYVSTKINRQFFPEKDTSLIWPEEPEKPKKPADRWIFSKKEGWHVLKRPAAHAADTHITTCRKGIGTLGVTFSDDAPVYTKEIACDQCRKRVEHRN